MALQITQVPLLALLIDRGRRRHQHLGVTVSGPMDWFAFELNRYILGLPHDAAQIELHQGRFSALIETDTLVSAAGRDTMLTINQQPRACARVHKVRAGDVISVENPSRIAYFALAGVIQCASAYGSQSCVVREHVGGIDGQGSALAEYDKIRWQSLGKTPRPLTQPQIEALLRLSKQVYTQRAVGIITGPQRQRFSRCEWIRFMTNEYVVSGQRNRMGYRLCGASIQARDYKMRSEPLLMGTIQMPADGQPIAMMADHQTLGGYPKIAQIVRCDLPYFAQLATNGSVSFTEVDPAIASFKYHRILDRLAHITAPN